MNSIASDADINVRFTRSSQVSAQTDASRRRGGRGVYLQFHISDFDENC